MLTLKLFVYTVVIFFVSFLSSSSDFYLMIRGAIRDVKNKT